MKNTTFRKIIASSLFCVLTISFVKAQNFSEPFENISTLTGSGWAIVNNSVPVGTATNWFQGVPSASGGPFDAYNGSSDSYAEASFNFTSGNNLINGWLITPNRTFRNGDVLTFYTRKNAPESNPDRLEVRMSTNGASTNTGGPGDNVGDFTNLLLSINPNLNAGVYPTTWTPYTVTISGLPAPTSGRIAFRYYVTNGGPSGPNSEYIGIDQVDYTQYVCPGLSLSPSTVSNGVAGQAYSQALSQTGSLGAPNYAITAGALPPGLTLSASGTISGTPTATGTFNFTVTVSDASGCSGFRAYSITCVCGPNPTTLNGLPTLCNNDDYYTLVEGLPGGGTYSGTGVSGDVFDPSAGTQTITYDYTDPYGCPYSSSNPITVNTSPVVSIDTLDAVCDNTGMLALTTGTPAGGVYSGTGVSGGMFDPMVGPQTITYTYTDANGCSNSIDAPMFVNPAPIVSIDTLDPICSNEIVELTTGTPAGGIYSGTGVSGQFFDGMAGPQTVTYTYTDANNGCASSISAPMFVNVAPTVSIDTLDPICSNAGPIELTIGTPSGGIYNGIGITGSEFDPTAGSQTINYTYIDANNCVGTISAPIFVNTAPTVTLDPLTSICQNADPVQLSGGSPAGGVFSGTNVSGGLFDPSAGTQTITYTYTDANGCISSADQTYTVLGIPLVILSPFVDLCENAANFTLEGALPMGGTYSGIGVTGNEFDPSVGSQAITYSYTDANGCSDSVTQPLTVNPNTNVTLNLTQDQLCIYNSAVTLSGGTPANGIYSGDGVTSGSFDPATAGLGTTTVTYTYTSDHGCVDTATDEISVDECLGINEESAAIIFVYPNPGTGLFHVSGLNENATLKVLDAQGRVVTFIQTTISNTEVSIDLSAMPNGIYLLNAGNNVIRLMKN